MIFGDRIDRRQCRAFGFGRLHGNQRFTIRGADLPIMGAQFLERALATFYRWAVAGAIEPLAVNAHARRDDEALDWLCGKAFQQNSRALRVVVRVVGNLVHALTNADGRRKMEYAIDPLQRAADCLAVPNVTANEFHFTREVRRPTSACAMHLRRKVVEHAYAVSGVEQFVRYM